MFPKHKAPPPPQRAGFRVRAAAYLIDAIPIGVLTALVFYLFLGFDATLAARMDHPEDTDARIRFLIERQHIRDASILLFLVYGILMEASALQGTFGKLAMGLRVVNPDGGRLSLGQAIKRNLGKLLSHLPFGLGLLWAARTKEARTWHDMMSKCVVIEVPRESRGALAPGEVPR